MVMQKRPFTLPLDDMVCAGDTLRSHAHYKLVVYTDSSQCASCKIRSMRNWNPFAERLDTSEDKVDLLFIFHPAFKSRPTLNFVMRVMPPSGFVYVDTSNCFARSNPQMPANHDLHTFLLDEENNVLLVGNPLDNHEIAELFWKIIKERRIKEQSDAGDSDLAFGR